MFPPNPFGSPRNQNGCRLTAVRLARETVRGGEPVAGEVVLNPQAACLTALSRGLLFMGFASTHPHVATVAGITHPTPNGIGLLIHTRPVSMDLPEAIIGGQSVKATVTFSGPAPAGGVTLSLRSGDPAIQVPATVQVPAGATEASFSLKSSPVTERVNSFVVASRGDRNNLSVGLEILPSARREAGEADGAPGARTGRGNRGQRLRLWPDPGGAAGMNGSTPFGNQPPALAAKNALALLRPVERFLKPGVISAMQEGLVALPPDQLQGTVGRLNLAGDRAWPAAVPHGRPGAVRACRKMR